jgi:hypothetical protein
MMSSITESLDLDSGGMSVHSGGVGRALVVSSKGRVGVLTERRSQGQYGESGDTSGVLPYLKGDSQQWHGPSWQLSARSLS